MTAINAIADRDRAYLLADTATYNSSGLITSFSAKARTLPHLNIAFAVTGTVYAGNEIAGVFGSFDSYESAIDGIAAGLRQAYADGQLYCGLETPKQKEFRVIICGWSPARGPEVFAISSNQEPSAAPFTLVKKGCFITPGLSAEELAQAGILVDGKIQFDDPAQCLAAMIDLQRCRVWESGNYIIGGAAVLTTIDEGGISQRVVRRWADRVNEMINPFRDDSVISESPPSAVITAGLSRLQRDIAARKAKKQQRLRAV
jgi:hypothetical protein